MEWNQLQKFMVVARSENFSKAAQILHMTQPSLSQTIKRLESELGYQLFTRDGKKVQLNESGRLFLQTVIQMDELMQNTKIRLEELNNICHSEVSIRFSAASQVLPELLLYLKKRNPQTQYHIRQGQVEKGAREDDIQILSGMSGSHRLSEGDVLLLDEKILLALPKNHKLLEKQTITVHDLQWEEFIILSDEWELGKIVKETMELVCLAPNTTMEVDNPNMMRELLKAKLGIAFIPALSWDAFAGDEIVLRQVEGIDMGRFIYLHTRPRKYLTKEQKECIRGIKEFFTDIGRE